MRMRDGGMRAGAGASRAQQRPGPGDGWVVPIVPPCRVLLRPGTGALRSFRWNLVAQKGWGVSNLRRENKLKLELQLEIQLELQSL